MAKQRTNYSSDARPKLDKLYNVTKLHCVQKSKSITSFKCVQKSLLVSFFFGHNEKKALHTYTCFQMRSDES